MNKEITIYELIVKKFNNEELPLNIRFLGKTYTLNYPNNDYINDDNEEIIFLFKDILEGHALGNLNQIIEILDNEENEEFEDIEKFKKTLVKYEDIDYPGGRYNEEYDYKKEEIFEKLNQLIRNQKKIIEKIKQYDSEN